jgi:RNA polymerase sigma factor (sigma-70 family)
VLQSGEVTVLQNPMVITPEVVGSLNPALVRYAARFMSRADAEDAVQETWLCALRHGASVRDTAALQAWLRTILRRRMVDQRRKSDRFGPLDRDVESPSDDEPTARHDLAGARPHITSGLSRLTPLERQAVYLVDVSEVDRDAAASKLKVSRGHLRVLLHRGRARLGKHLTRLGVCA